MSQMETLEEFLEYLDTLGGTHYSAKSRFPRRLYNESVIELESMNITDIELNPRIEISVQIQNHRKLISYYRDWVLPNEMATLTIYWWHHARNLQVEINMINEMNIKIDYKIGEEEFARKCWYHLANAKEIYTVKTFEISDE